MADMAMIDDFDKTEALIKIDREKVEHFMRMRNMRSLRNLAILAGVHYNTINNCLRDGKDNGFSSDTLARLATALNCSPIDLMTCEGFAEPFSRAPVMP